MSVSPRSLSALTRFEPMKPAAPVTIIMQRFLSGRQPKCARCGAFARSPVRARTAPAIAAARCRAGGRARVVPPASVEFLAGEILGKLRDGDRRRTALCCYDVSRADG